MAEDTDTITYAARWYQQKLAQAQEETARTFAEAISHRVRAEKAEARVKELEEGNGDHKVETP